MILLLLLAAAAFAPLFGADRIVSWQRKNNVILIDLATGRAEIEWLNHSTFRFLRCKSKTCAGREGLPDPADFQVAETAAALVFRTSYIEVQLRKSDATVTARASRGFALIDEIAPASPGLFFERRAAPAERFYGLGPRTDPVLDLRGKRVNSSVGLLISSAGFGQYFTATGGLQFDIARSLSDRVQVRATSSPQQLEYFFYYGPTPKEILEEHGAVVSATTKPTPVPAMPAADLAAYLSHASMSGVLVPEVSTNSLPPVFQLAPSLQAGATTALRKPFETYLYTYLMEARDRSIPMIHPMAMQFPSDPECGRRAGQFFLGDELLVAPGDDVYLPQGLWTDLRTNQTYKGRQTIAVPQADGLPLFARNGSVVPLQRTDGVMELHYFPKLGGEFFIAEPGDDSPTQVHAAPAGDVMRLEIESRVDRAYEWVIHHATGLQRVPMKATAGSDVIQNVALPDLQP